MADTSGKGLVTFESTEKALAGFQERISIATLLFESGIFSDVKSAAQAFAKIQQGAELGLGPMTSLREIYFGDGGKPGVSVHCQAMLLKRAGYDYDILELSDQACRIQYYRMNKGQRVKHGPEISFTADKARATMIWEKGKQIYLAQKWNYKSWLQEMLYAAAMRRGVKWLAPEALGGIDLGAREEVFDEVIVPGEALTAAAHEKNVKDLFGDTAVIDVETGEISEDVSTPPAARESIDTTKGTAPEPQKNGHDLQQGDPPPQKAQAIALLNTAQALKRTLPKGEALDTLHKALKPIQEFVGGKDMAPGEVAFRLEELQGAMSQGQPPPAEPRSTLPAFTRDDEVSTPEPVEEKLL